MSVVLVDPMVLPVMTDMLAALENQAQCLKDPPALASLRPGDVIELLASQNNDECCAGLAWVRNVTIYPSTNFPDQDSEASNCGPLAWAVVLEVGIARCAPVPDVDDLPTSDDWANATGQVMADAAAIRRAVKLFKTLPDWEDSMWVVGAWTPLRTEGGCMGGAMQVTISMLDCDTIGVCE